MLTANPAHSRARGRSPRSTNRGGVDGRSPAGVGIPRLETVNEDGTLTESYAYDANGNRESALNSAGVSTAAFDNQDRILSSGDYEYDFTPNGELASKTNIVTNDVTTYAYDAIGNLLTVNLPNGDVIEYLVDAAGRRVGKKVNGVLERRWLWRGKLQPVAELDGAGNLVARFVYANGVNVPELMVTPGGTYRLVKDHLGSVRLVTNASTGAIVQELKYDAWGRVLSDTNPGFQPFGFAGGLYEAETGLVRFGARDYDPEIGRWAAKDPIRFAGGLNLYAYASNDPVDVVDSSGHAPTWDPLAPNRLEKNWDPSKISDYVHGRECSLADEVFGGCEPIPAAIRPPFVPQIRFPQCHTVPTSDIDRCCRFASGYFGDDDLDEVCPDLPPDELQKYLEYLFCVSESLEAQGFGGHGGLWK